MIENVLLEQNTNLRFLITVSSNESIRGRLEIIIDDFNPDRRIFKQEVSLHSEEVFVRGGSATNFSLAVPKSALLAKTSCRETAYKVVFQPDGEARAALFTSPSLVSEVKSLPTMTELEARWKKKWTPIIEREGQEAVLNA